MRKRDYRDYLQDILDSIKDIEEFTRNMDFEDFARDKKTINAVIRSIEVIGEAAKHIPKSVRDKVSFDSMEEDGWNEGQIDPRILRRRRQNIMENNKERYTAAQTTDREHSGELGLKP
ncbi:MAG: HepT-like ribonuclease domain-containing protein [Thermoproteota archaeon]